jgi:hypothetical protein
MTKYLIFLFKMSKHNIYLTVKFTNKIHPLPPFSLFSRVATKLQAAYVLVKDGWVELALNNSVIMLPTKIYVDQPKSKSAIALTKIILNIYL